MSYKEINIKVEGYYKYTDLETSNGPIKVRKWVKPYNKKIKVWLPQK